MKLFKFITILSVLVFFSSSSFSQDAKEIVKKADEKFRGKSGYNEMTMTIVRPNGQEPSASKAVIKAWIIQ